MDLVGIAAIIGSLTGLGGVPLILWKAAKSSAKKDLVADQNALLVTQLKAENDRLWNLLDTLTNPGVVR